MVIHDGWLVLDRIRQDDLADWHPVCAASPRRTPTRAIMQLYRPGPTYDRSYWGEVVRMVSAFGEIAEAFRGRNEGDGWVLHEILRVGDNPMHIVLEERYGLTLRRALQGLGPLSVAASCELGLRLCAMARRIAEVDPDARFFTSFNANDLRIGDNAILIGPHAYPKGILPPRIRDAPATQFDSLAPEQVEGRSQYDHGAAVFQIGAIVLHASVGISPFLRSTTFETLDAIRRSAPVGLAMVPVLRPILERALARDPAARPNVDELEAGLAAARDEAARHPSVYPNDAPFEHYAPVDGWSFTLCGTPADQPIHRATRRDGTHYPTITR